jgi:quercetin dioxygenase-like cupin family protein
VLLLKGHGLIYTDEGDEPAGEGDVVFTQRGHWLGFNNTSDEEVTLV